MNAAREFLDHPLSGGNPPEWASGWGEDRFGPWVEIEVDGVVQRLRWIPQGRFMMGSPDDEPGRFNQEGPRHEVTLARGFWLFDTPVTQALWHMVMGEARSRFRGDQRPVEQVTWEQANAFLERINERIPGLDLVLPTEAQWERACRAGSNGPLYRVLPSEAVSADELAWCSANSGRETHDVKQKSPNAWGLYDMLGNVWEWTEDHWHGHYRGAPEDGKAWYTGPGGSRVVRGGSWLASARFVSCAVRNHNRPGGRFGDLGFRCARVQA
ncbi:MAG: formylglycine-generating enzyme family protein [Gammaproteobacteria bacterium]|nr:formylglycine-generating enzyme family protein [Gammaproteobacteria bacterium]MCP5135816.1 formylglycine-generating enzyme family protein [Gammaproteobacteria bacterium]